MPAAVAVPLILGGAAAGASVYGANKQAKAAKDAAATQTDYGNRSLDLQKQMYEQDRADQQPYRNIGYGALNTLGSMLGPKFNAGGGGFQPSMGSQPSGGGQPTGAPPIGNGFSFGAPQTSGTVLMQAPNGQTKQVPREQVAHYQQMGARVIG